MKCGTWPLGTWCLSAVRRIRRNWISPALQEEGSSSRRANASSASRVKEIQSAFLMLEKVMWGGSTTVVEKHPLRLMMMGRWSEFRVVWGDQSKSRAMWGVEMVRSGELGSPWDGSLVGASELRSTKLLSVSASSM